MENEPAFAHVEPKLLPILDELRSLEPIFHRSAFGINVDDFARMMAPDYWEVGASGRRYSRDSILRYLEEHPPVDAQAAEWVCSDFGLRLLGPTTYLLTYTLDQVGRVTRRATIWQQTDRGWQILYHQGTRVATHDDDAMPSKREATRQ
jgi:hypothetical protein